MKEGDTIENSQILCDVETDKAVMEYESKNEGTLLRIFVSEGREARVGEVIAVVGEKDEDISEILGGASVVGAQPEEEISVVRAKPAAESESVKE